MIIILYIYLNHRFLFSSLSGISGISLQSLPTPHTLRNRWAGWLSWVGDDGVVLEGDRASGWSGKGMCQINQTFVDFVGFVTLKSRPLHVFVTSYSQHLS